MEHQGTSRSVLTYAAIGVIIFAILLQIYIIYVTSATSTVLPSELAIARELERMSSTTSIVGHACVRVNCYRGEEGVKEILLPSQITFALLDEQGRLTAKQVQAACGITEDRVGLVEPPQSSGFAIWRTQKGALIVGAAQEFVPVEPVEPNEKVLIASKKYLDAITEFLHSSPGWSNEFPIHPVTFIQYEAHVCEIPPSSRKGDGASAVPPRPRHHHTYCDHEDCRKEIVGTRWKCNAMLGCANFDYCADHMRQHVAACEKRRRIQASCGSSTAPIPLGKELHDCSHEFYPLHRPVLPARDLWADTAIELVLNSCANFGHTPFIAEMDPWPVAKDNVHPTISALQAIESGPPPDPSIRLKEYTWTTFTQMQSRFLALASSLRRILHVRDFVGLYSPNSSAWVATDWACLSQGFVSVAIHAGYTVDILQEIVYKTQLRLILCTEQQVPLICGMKERWKYPQEPCALRFLLVSSGGVDALSPETRQRTVAAGFVLLDYERFLTISLGTVEEPILYRPPEELSTLVYTSGSTGLPKGSMVTEFLVQHELGRSLYRYESQMSLEIQSFPLAWMTGRADIRHALVHGAGAVLYNGPASGLMSEFRKTAPTRILGVPAIWNELFSIYKEFARKKQLQRAQEQEKHLARLERVRKRMEQKEQEGEISDDDDGEEEQKSAAAVDPDDAGDSAPHKPMWERSILQMKSYLKGQGVRSKGIFEKAELVQLVKETVSAEQDESELSAATKRSVEEKEREPPIDYTVPAAHRFPFLTAFRKTHPVGARVDSVITGGAMSSPDLLAFIRALFSHMHVNDGYGTTETGGLMSNGVLRGHSEGKLVDLPELGYRTTDKPFPRGELLIRNKQMIQGYFKDPQATKEKFTDDGWFRTGDVVEEIAEREYRIIDRASSFFKLANGEFLSPEFIEGIYARSKFVHQVFVYGSSKHSGLVAIIVPAREELLRGLGEIGLSAPGLDDSLLAHPALELLVRADLARICKEAGTPLSHFPLWTYLSPEAFTVENRLLTVTSKIARHQLIERFRPKIDELYAKWEASAKQQHGQHDTHSVQPAVETSSLSSGSSSSSSSIPATASSSSSSVTDLTSILARVLNLSQQSLASNVDLHSLGLSSVAAMQLSQTVQKELGVSLPVQMLLKQDAPSVGELASIIDGHLAQGSAELALEESKEEDRLIQLVKSDMQLDLTPHPAGDSAVSFVDLYQAHCLTPAPSVSSLSTFHHILLTGVTGFLGGQLLIELLSKDPTAIVHCLVRMSGGKATPRAALEDRVRSSLQHRDLLTPELESRICVYAADIEQERFGLDPAVYESLTSNIAIIYHSAAAVNWILPYAALRQANVIGTQNVLRFAASVELLRQSSKEPSHVRVVHVSTVGVGRGGDDSLDEFLSPDAVTSDSVRSLIQRYSSGYNFSKLLSEWLVRTSRRLGLVTHSVIVRPGFIGPHSFSGDCGPSDFLTRYISTVLETRRFVDSLKTFEFTPVDEMAKRVIASFTTTESDSSSSSSLASASAPVFPLTSYDSGPLLSYAQIGVAIARVTPDDLCPFACSPDDFISIVRKSPSSLLFPLLSIIAEPTYFGSIRPNGAPTGSKKADPKALAAIEACAQRLYKQRSRSKL